MTANPSTPKLLKVLSGGCTLSVLSEGGRRNQELIDAPGGVSHKVLMAQGLDD